MGVKNFEILEKYRIDAVIEKAHISLHVFYIQKYENIEDASIYKDLNVLFEKGILRSKNLAFLKKTEVNLPSRACSGQSES